MRIEKISFQAFGPYINKVELAMEELYPHHLFLIKGSTGAGKTVILDAITFALYGKSSSGERGDFESMRSRSAGDKQKTFVELIFTVQGRRYRFYREIAVGKKRNGEALYKISVNGGELIEDQFYPFFENCKMTLLEKQAEQIIGLNHAQFIRTMILPQGKFERLLISNSEEKQEILKSLFQSERWARLCDALSEQLKQTKDHSVHMAAEIENLLKQAEVTSVTECRALILRLKEQLEPLREAVEQARQTMETKQRQIEEQELFSSLINKKTAYEAKLNELKQQEANIQFKRKQVETAKEVERISPYIRTYRESKKRNAEIKLKLQENVKELTELKAISQKLQEQSEAMSERKQQHDRLKQQCEQWIQQSALCDEREENKRAIEAMKQQYRLAESKMERQRAETVQLKQQRSTAQEQIIKLECVNEQHTRLRIEAERWKGKKILEEEIAQQKNQLSEWESAANKRKHMREALQRQECEVNIKHEQLYQAYLHDSAGLLAEMLTKGEPCPICGSTHHPNPAKAKAQLSELTKLKACKQEWDHLLRQIQEIDNWLKQAEVIKEQINQTISGKQQLLEEKYADLIDKNYELFLKDLKQSQESLQLLQKHKELLQTAEAKLPECEQTYETAHQQFQQVSERLLQLKAQSEERFRSILNVDPLVLRKQLEASKHQMKTNEALIAAWEKDMKVNQLHTASLQASVEHLKTEAFQAEREYEKAKQELQMKNHLQLDIDQELMDEHSVAKWTEEIQAYQDQFTKLLAAVEELNAQTKGIRLLRSETTAKEYEEAKQTYQNIVKEFTKQEYRLGQIIQTEQRLSVLNKAYEAELLTYARQGEFVKAMRGDTGIGIERYVLGIMLSHITRSANALLKNVHDGRYQLYRSDDTNGKVRKYGLELSIYDRVSATMRSAASLSGGEKFLVSLALSLALSTVVQARNTGVSMESMFIDEGFGSLDEASIADALQVLSSMANTKTMIGIISHVELLKENIPYGIEVTKGKHESSCRMLL